MGSHDVKVMSEAKNDESTLTILLQQYKMAEERRSEFGRQFMQTTGFAVPLFAAAVALAKPIPSVLRLICLIGGLFFFALAGLGYRLGQRQDDCEETLSRIENALRALGYSGIETLLPSKRRLGARKILVLFMVTVGILLLVIAFIGIRIIA